MSKPLRKAYVKDESPVEVTRLGEKEFLVRNPPVFDEDEKHLVRFWNRFIKFMQIERVR